MKYTQHMRNAAALCGLPVHIWAYRALNSAAFEVHTVCHEALEAKGLRNRNEIEERRREEFRKQYEKAKARDYPRITSLKCAKCDASIDYGMHCDDCMDGA